MSFVEPELVRIAEGAVLLGAPPCPADFALNPWRAPREVVVNEFLIGTYAVTRVEYECFLRESGHPEPADWRDPVLGDPRQPVGGVSADDADAYCRWMREKTGLSFRLPQVDEWEKAARGGFEGKKFPWGDEAPDGRCCYGLAGDGAPLPVGSYVPNGFGLFDMVGNIWQWMADLYVDVADNPPRNTPTGKPAEINRVLVGGSFMTSKPESLMIAYRHDDPPDLRHRCLGFRIALSA